MRNVEATQILGDGNTDRLCDVPVDRTSDVQAEEKRRRVENSTPVRKEQGFCLFV
ncbi:MAG: hypothetical protein LIO86_06125 [Lachnospiraceae bacterium]|nr:hypothetical protein [Lachnospiraceae bacterium]